MDDRRFLASYVQAVWRKRLGLTLYSPSPPSSASSSLPFLPGIQSYLMPLDQVARGLKPVHLASHRPTHTRFI
jgi:hypothetical protein